jgi:type II secretory pathway predicted ATPase ExeA/peptidoglycan hydrolase-like protein with peptidoglycan-binding domain
MSYKYFGLREESFGISPDLRFIYLDTARENISKHLTSGIHKSKGLMLLSAKRGMGKTVMLRYLAAKLQTDGEIDLLAPTGVLSCNGSPSFNDIVIACREGFGVFDEGVGQDYDESHLAAILKRTYTGNAPPALLLDGAEHLSGQALESIVALSALPAEERGYLSIVLAGCPDSPEKPIDATFATQRRLADASVSIQRLPDHDIEPFIRHRLQVAGQDGSELFAPDAIDRIIRYSEGNPLAINRICRSAMVVASLETSRIVTAPMVESAVMVEEVANGRRGRAPGDRSAGKTARPAGPSDMERLPGAPTESIEIPEMPPGPAGYVSGAATAETEDPGGEIHFGNEPDSGVGNTIDIEKSAGFAKRRPRDDFPANTYFWKRSLERIEFLSSFVWKFLEKSVCRAVQFAVSNKPRVKHVGQSLKKPTRNAVQFMLSNKPRLFVLSIVFGMFLIFLKGTVVFFEDPPAQSSHVTEKAMHELLDEADRGSALAQYRLGQMFEEGRGIPRDVAMSHAWYALATAQGMPEASKARDALAGKMTREQLAEAYRLAIKWTHGAKKKGSVAGAFPNLLKGITNENADAAKSDGDGTVVSDQPAAELDPDAIDGNVETSSNKAVESGSTAVIEAASDAGAEVNAPGNEERKPLNTAPAGGEDAVALLIERNTDPTLGDADGKVVSDPVPDEGDPVSPVLNGTDNGTSQTQLEPDAFETAAGHEDTAGGNQFDTVSREEITRDLLGATVGDGNSVAVTTPGEAPPSEVTSRPEETSQPEGASRPEETSQQASRQPAASPTDAPAGGTDDRAAAAAASKKIQRARIKPDSETTARTPSPKPSRPAAKTEKTPPVQETRVKTAQDLLSRLGYDPGPADGLAGSKTRAAVRAYQKHKGEAADGRITEALVNRLDAEVVAGKSRRLAETEKRREMEERRKMEAALNTRRENKNVLANILSGFQKAIGYEFNSTEDPDKMSAYCNKNVENWIYDFGTEQFVLCRDFVQRQATVSR